VRFDGLLDLVKCKLNSRHGLGGPPSRELVGPGGNLSPNPSQFLHKHSDKHFPIDPSAGAAIVMFGQVTQLGKVFQPLKH